MPRVSVVAAAYNHEKYVDEAIRSVLAQDFKDFELVVTDDCSTDRTVEKIRRFNDPRLKLICHESNKGCSPTYNNSFAHSSGDYIAWLNTDDVYEPHHLATLVDYLDQKPEMLGVFGLARVIDGTGEPIGEFSSIGVGADRYQLLRQLFQRQRPFNTQSGLVRREVIQKLGHMELVFGQSHDTALFMKVLFEGPVSVLPEYIVRYRRHDTNRSGGETAPNLNRGMFENFELLNIYLDRIKSAQLLEKIFPEVHETKWPVADRFVQFHLAHLAMSCDSACNQLFGLHLMHQLMKQPESAAMLQEECDFSYNDLFRCEESLSVFASGSIQLKINALNHELKRAREIGEEMRIELESTRNDMNAMIESEKQLMNKQMSIEHELNAMKNSRLWRFASYIRRLLLRRA